MNKSLLRSLVVMGLLAGPILLGTSCADKSMVGAEPYDYLIGSWSALVIEGALDSQGNPLDTVNGDMSTLTFNEDRTYSWFLHAPPYYNLDGTGRYVASPSFSSRGDRPDQAPIYLEGPVAEYLGVKFIRYTEGTDTIEFRDEDGDKWVYVK